MISGNSVSASPTQITSGGAGPAVSLVFPREALVSDLRLAAADALGIDSADDGATGEASVGPVILARVATPVILDMISLRHLPTPPPGTVCEALLRVD